MDFPRKEKQNSDDWKGSSKRKREGTGDIWRETAKIKDYLRNSMKA